MDPQSQGTVELLPREKEEGQTRGPLSPPLAPGIHWKSSWGLPRPTGAEPPELRPLKDEEYHSPVPGRLGSQASRAAGPGTKAPWSREGSGSSPETRAPIIPSLSFSCHVYIYNEN